MYEKLVTLQSAGTLLRLLRFACADKELGFAPSDGLAGSAPESDEAPAEAALRSKATGALWDTLGVLGASRCRAGRCRDPPAPIRVAPPCRLRARQVFRLMGIDIW